MHVPKGRMYRLGLYSTLHEVTLHTLFTLPYGRKKRVKNSDIKIKKEYFKHFTI